VIAGVWGVESNFGKDIGGRPLVQSLATLSCYAPRRRAYFAGELFATLKIVQNGDIPNSRFCCRAGLVQIVVASAVDASSSGEINELDPQRAPVRPLGQRQL
jgi:hypothetical protein